MMSRITSASTAVGKRLRRKQPSASPSCVTSQNGSRFLNHDHCSGLMSSSGATTSCQLLPSPHVEA
jgi:hypothetical protein